MTHFRKYPTSTIKVGARCSFRSAFRSNLVGLNRPCAISTHTKTARIVMGDGCGLSATIIAAANSITLGSNVLCGANVTITDFDWHSLAPQDRRAAARIESAPITIEDNVWLGLNVVVLRGATVGKNTVVGAYSVVTSSLPPNVIAAGIPARIVRPLTEC